MDISIESNERSLQYLLTSNIFRNLNKSAIESLFKTEHLE